MRIPDRVENQPAAPSSWPESVADSAVPRPRTAGKFLAVGDAKLWVRGVTYGPFRPDASGSEYPAPDVLGREFALMTAHGLNTIRTYTVPPPALLDAAAAHVVKGNLRPHFQDTASIRQSNAAPALPSPHCFGH